MIREKEYFVFISYSSLDNEWAIWLRHELEHYHLPASFNGRTDVRDNLRKVFRDRDELSAGSEWDEQVQKALEDTNNLIVICSPHSAKSEAVNKEVETFIALGKEDHIFPFIVEGDKPEDCFPPALSYSKLGGDIKKDGSPNIAFIKIVAGMLRVGFSELWNRYEIEKAEEDRKIREQRDNLFRVQSRFLSEKAITLADKGDSYTARLLMMEAVPTPSNQDYPYTAEAEKALRYINDFSSVILRDHTDFVRSAIYSHKGEFIVSASWDKTIRIWDINTGICIRTLFSYGSSITYASISPDDKLIASASEDGTIRLWSVETGEEICAFEGHTARVNSVLFSHDGRLLVSASGETFNHTPSDIDRDLVMVWDIFKRERVLTLSGHKTSVHHAVFSYDDSIIASASYDGMICLWDIRSGEKITSFDGQAKDIEHLDFLLDGEEIALSSNAGDLNIWNVKTSQLVRTISTGGHARYVICHHRKNNIAAIIEHSVCVWNALTGRCLKRIEVHIPSREGCNSISFSPDGKRIVLAASDGTVRILDVFSPDYVEFVGHKDIVIATCFSPGGKMLISSSESFEKAIRVWDVKSTENICTIWGHTSRIKSLAFSSKRNAIISASHDRTVRFWNTDGTEQFVINLKDSGVNSISLSPDETFLACAQDGRVSLWDIDTKQCLWVLEGKFSDCSNSVSYSPDGELIAATWGYQVILLQAADGKLVKQLDGHNDFIFSVSFSHDGTRIVSASRDKTVMVWDVESGECIQVLGHTADMTFAKFILDDSVIVSTSWDGFVRTWNLADGSLLYELNTHTFALTSISISPAGDQLAFAASERVLMLQYPRFEEIIDGILTRFKNIQLTPETRKKYYLD